MPQGLFTSGAFIARCIITAVLVFGYNLLMSLYGLVQAPLQGDFAVKQLEASDLAYAQSKFVIDGGFQSALLAVVCITVVLMWSVFVLAQFKVKSATTQNSSPNN